MQRQVDEPMRGRAIIAISCASLAALLLAEVRQRRTSRFDLRVLASLRGREPRGFRRAAAILAKPVAVMAETAVLALLTSRKPRVAFSIAAAPSLALSVSWAVKTFLERARPPAHLFQREGLSSFPSGHTAGTSALLLTLASACPASHPVRVSATVLAALQIVFVAAARIADSAHWPTDTLAGAAIGVAASETVCLLARSVPPPTSTPA